MPAPTGADRPTRGQSRLSVEPFWATRYADAATLGRRTSPAYDLVDADRRTELERADPHNVVRLILPDDGTGPPGRGPEIAARTLNEWRTSGVLTVDDKPCLYIYEMTAADGRTRGVLGTIPVLDPADGGVLPHESTYPPVVQNRLELLRATQTNLEPVVVAYEPDGDEPLPSPPESTPPDLSLSCEDGVQHQVWRITDPDRIQGIQRSIQRRPAVIADGHHRYASYLAYRTQRQAVDGPGPWDRALAYVVPTSGDGLRVRAIHRVVLGLDLTTAVDLARPAFRVTELTGVLAAVGAGIVDALADLPPASLVVSDGESAYLLDEPDDALRQRSIGAAGSATWRELDAVLAHRMLIETLWGLGPDSSAVRVSPLADAALQLARRDHGIAVLLRAPRPDDVLAVARSGDLMPRKSTLFVPKPRTGIVLRCYADEP